MGSKKFRSLLENSRFWVLASGILLSFVVLGFVDQLVASESLRVIRVEQIYGFIALFLLLFVLLISPVYKNFPKLPFSHSLSYNRRPLGVLVFYYGLLHVLISFFGQLDGFSGLVYLNKTYLVSLLAGTIALMILLAMAVTSVDPAVKKMGFNRWKALQRLVYLALILILLHVVLIGTHYVSDKGVWFVLTIIFLGLFIILKYILPNIKNIFIFIGLFCLVSFMASPVSAHELESDNTVGAVLHVDPDDNPRLGQRQGFVLAFRDKSGQFDLKNCDCQYRLIDKGSQEIYSEKLIAKDKTNSLNYYTFEKAGIYQIEVTGAPNNASDFQPFKLVYDIRVIGPNGGSSDHLTATLLVSLALLQLFILLGLVYKIKK